MSSLIYCTDTTQVMVATDTLAAVHGGARHAFVSKAFMVPHLRMIIAGTGVGGFAGDWAREVNDWMVTRSIDNLDAHTPEALRSRWKAYLEKFQPRETLTTTVYHFGFSEAGEMRVYVYRSTKDFESESQPVGGIGAKPDCNLNQPISLPADFVKLMHEQRALQALEPVDKRIHIGGEIHVIHLTASGFNCWPLHRFDDYESDWTEMTNNLHKDGE